MPEVSAYQPGTFCWVELATTDAAAAKRFYGELFGWEGKDGPAGPDMIYTMLRLRGKDIGGLYGMDQKRQAGMRPNWLSYVSVASADESAKRAAELGAKVVAGPFDVLDAGRMATLVDPTGATFALWQPIKHFGAQLVNEPGSLAWNELITKDVEAARQFYSALFGWTYKVQDMGPMIYTTFQNGDRPAAGLFAPRPEMGEMPPSWTVYFAVADADAAFAKATALGARELAPPFDIPEVGRMAALADPQGAAFDIFRLLNPAP